ncbi:hypothetical protein EJ110_NYTH41406 [Nymphaea thermarum]|nr:hypothetical protein EJ110_NYTH41406 [Nymphaea thermarum]
MHTPYLYETYILAQCADSGPSRENLTWTEAQMDYLVQLLVEQSRIPGMKSGGGLKSKAYTAIEKGMIDKFGLEFSKEKIKNKLKTISSDMVDEKFTTLNSSYASNAPLRKNALGLVVPAIADLFKASSLFRLVFLCRLTTLFFSLLERSDSGKALHVAHSPFTLSVEARIIFLIQQLKPSSLLTTRIPSMKGIGNIGKKFPTATNLLVEALSRVHHVDAFYHAIDGPSSPSTCTLVIAILFLAFAGRQILQSAFLQSPTHLNLPSLDVLVTARCCSGRIRG